MLITSNNIRKEILTRYLLHGCVLGVICALMATLINLMYFPTWVPSASINIVWAFGISFAAILFMGLVNLKHTLNIINIKERQFGLRLEDEEFQEVGNSKVLFFSNHWLLYQEGTTYELLHRSEINSIIACGERQSKNKRAICKITLITSEVKQFVYSYDAQESVEEIIYDWLYPVRTSDNSYQPIVPPIGKGYQYPTSQTKPSKESGIYIAVLVIAVLLIVLLVALIQSL